MATSLEEAIRAADAAGDSVGIRVVLVWLELAEQLDGTPNQRQVAARAGVSHVTVGNVLTRFRKNYF
jgi:hypothetical protein